MMNRLTFTLACTLLLCLLPLLGAAFQDTARPDGPTAAAPMIQDITAP